MSDRYVVINESDARARKLPGYETPAESRWDDTGWALFECNDAGTPVRFVFRDRMEPEDAILVRDLHPLVEELNRLATSRAPSVLGEGTDARVYDHGPGFIRARECPDCGHTRCGEDCNCDCDAARAEYEAATLRQTVANITAQKDGAYRERDQVVALVARMALAMGWRAGLRRHEPDPDPLWDEDWKNVVAIDLPTGQVTWHFHDSERDLFHSLPPYTGSWDGHDTAEKYRRVNAAAPGAGDAGLREVLANVLNSYDENGQRFIGSECLRAARRALASPPGAPAPDAKEPAPEPVTCERCGYVGGGGWLPGWDTDPAGTQPRGMKCPDCNPGPGSETAPSPDAAKGVKP